MNRFWSFSDTTDRRAAATRLRHRMGGLGTAIAASMLPHIAWSAGCIPSGTEADINAALSGPNSRAVLCPRATFRLSHRIVLSSDGQQLFTETLPTDDSRARIEVADGNLSTAIFSRASNISVHHLIVDGARTRYGRDPKGEALIDLGGDVSGINTVDHVRAFDPRGWSVLHVFEGRKDCSGARVAYNDIGPSGGPNHEWADGISFACRDGFIQHNTINDASDGAIVIFGAPGTLVEDNLIVTRSNILLGGINLVDYGPFDGDYRNHRQAITVYKRLVATSRSGSQRARWYGAIGTVVSCPRRANNRQHYRRRQPWVWYSGRRRRGLHHYRKQSARPIRWCAR